MKGLLGVENCEELRFELFLKTKNFGKVTLPTMFSDFSKQSVLFCIPIYETNENLCFPKNLRNLDEEDSEYGDYAFFEISGAENIFKLFNGEEVLITNVVGRHLTIDVTKEIISQKMLTIKCFGEF